MKEDADEVIERLGPQIKAKLDAVIAKGYTPSMVLFPSQKTGTKECRGCGTTKGDFGVAMTGKELDPEKVFIYTVAMVCRTCGGSKERMDRLGERIEAQYRAHESP